MSHTRLRLMAVALAFAFSGNTQATQLLWGPCPWSSPSDTSRVTCSRLRVPVDHDVPTGPAMDIGIMRIPAMRSDVREGAIFFHFGGPGLHPRDFLPSMIARWETYDAADPLHGDKRRIAERYDAIAVIPRGLPGGTRVSCEALAQDEPRRPSRPPDDAQWQEMLGYTRAVVDACQNEPLAPFIDTYQHIGDTEAVRVALGEPYVNYFGTSYGTRVAMAYASRYPGSVRRLLLDSSIDPTVSVATLLDQGVEERDRIVSRQAIGLAANDPSRWQLGADREAIRLRVKQMPGDLRGNVVPWLDGPETLAAALTLSDWMAGTAHAAADDLRKRVAEYRFHVDDDTHQLIRSRAEWLVEMHAGERPDIDADELSALSVNLMTLCNDERWTTSTDEIRDMTSMLARRHITWDGREAAQKLVCAHWPHRLQRPAASVPVMPPRPFLMIQAEYDAYTPLRGAARMADRMEGAHLVVGRGLQGHYLFDRTDTPCIEQAAGRYLLSGELPTLKHTSCPGQSRKTSP
ncbi:alpha/beta hydrolase [Rothia nasimurium]|uniref:Alpha/beta hydrolase n=1 Tax=Luteibacter anthropi TaxID=564369 RepID=A0A7X5U6N1_9GAMM|nr:alpha/beta fold hydrolase [Luteibacter anthropi]NII04832.1 alpha/beta hydrolase [Luteibacter anthropi]